MMGRRQFLGSTVAACMSFAGMANGGGMGKIRVALYVDRGGRSNGALMWAWLLTHSPEIESFWFDHDDLLAGRLAEVQVLVVPGGSSGLQTKTLGEEGREKVRAFLRAGGCYFGTCAGCSLAQDVPEMLRLFPYKKKLPALLRGSTMIGVDITAEGASILGVKEGRRTMCFHSGPLMEPTFPESVPDCRNLKILATYAGSICQKGDGPEPFPMQGMPAVFWADYGKGKVLATSFHPEYYPLTHDFIAGGFRALTGCEVSFVSNPKPRGALRVGYFSPGIQGRASFLPTIALDALPNVDYRPIDGEKVNEGELDHLDALVLPDGDMDNLVASLKPFVRERIDAFAARGRKVLAWGGACAHLPPVNGLPFGTSDEMIAVVKRLAAE